MGTLLNRRRYMGGHDEIIMTSETNPEVLAVLYAHGGAKHADYMTKSEAEAVTSIGSGANSWFRYNTSITHFEEFQYFCNIVLNRNNFEGCTALKTITMPSAVTVFPNALFKECEALETITKNLITSIGVYCFRNCKALSSYTFDSGLTSIGSAAFYSNQSITFTNDIPSTVTSIGDQAFQSIGHTGKLTIPSGITTVGQRLFLNSKCSEIVLPSTITSVNNFAFYGTSNLESMTIYATTPPLIGSDVFSHFGKTGCVIYVPAESVEAYKSAKYWMCFLIS